MAAPLPIPDKHSGADLRSANKRRELTILSINPLVVKHHGRTLGPEGKPTVALDLIKYWEQYAPEQRTLLARTYRIDKNFLEWTRKVRKEVLAEFYTLRSGFSIGTTASRKALPHRPSVNGKLNLTVQRRPS